MLLIFPVFKKKKKTSEEFIIIDAQGVIGNGRYKATGIELIQEHGHIVLVETDEGGKGKTESIAAADPLLITSRRNLSGNWLYNPRNRFGQIDNALPCRINTHIRTVLFGYFTPQYFLRKIPQFEHVLGIEVALKCLYLFIVITSFRMAWRMIA